MQRLVGRLSRSVSSHPSRQIRTFKVKAQGSILAETLDQISTLSNGVRVATESLPGHFSAVGAFVDAGSRYELPDMSGVSHIVDRLSFKSTKTRSADEMLTSLELLGGSFMCSSSRESLMYQASIFNSEVEPMTELLADTIRNPLITEEEVDAQRATAAYEIAEIWQKPEMILPELLHTAAFRGNTLGNPLLCPEDRLPLVNASIVKKYRETFFKPERIVLGFVGIPHTTAITLAQKYFGDMAATNPTEPLAKPGLLKSFFTQKDPMYAPAHYTGGIVSLPSSALPNEEWTHLHIGFEGLALHDPDIYALATLQILLGGGGSFSAGGPGKGMYSRLYTNVLNQYGWIESCQSFNHSYTDSGLFGISASCRPDASYAMSGVICKELATLFSQGSSQLTEGEVERAKNQLRSSLLMNLESKMIVLEDLGRQIQGLDGKRIPPQEMCDNISALTIADLKRVAERVLTGSVRNLGKGTGQPSIVSAGPGVEKIGDVFGTCSRFGLGRKRR